MNDPAPPGDGDAGLQHEPLAIEDLEQTCLTCQGQGTRVDPAWQVWRERLRELADAAREAREAAGLPPETPATGMGVVIDIHGGAGQSPPVDVPSAVADAERALDDHMDARPLAYEQRRCALCRGNGVVLTDLGVELVALLERHGFVRSFG
ncbi:hypothetical protein [Spongiactinospora sp. TRM90649]|uniref:hypothetical protein n=1 Tax=Spongiactinospora sp. TRM90649 TaxID=3031114 RepID=UPI0023F89C9C|nr:hypothetical protein [Spongiactinospora sp. TRM90649]MDF5754570.1 hypothetical protein [Spongiactinospora sp. TRM90649]